MVLGHTFGSARAAIRRQLVSPLRCNSWINPPQQRWIGVFAQYRIDLWTQELERQRAAAPNNEQIIAITLPNGPTKHVQAGSVRPLDIALEINPNARQDYLFASTNTKTWDLGRPLTDSCALDFTKADTDDETALDSLWHSGAHVLGWALETKYGDDILLCDGPALKLGGFFYDGIVKRNYSPPCLDADADPDLVEAAVRELLKPDSRYGSTYNLNDADLKEIDSIAKKLAKKNAEFRRLQVTRQFASQMFKHNPFKLSFLQQIPESDPVTLYRCGDFIDLCRGPHVYSTGQVRAIKLLRTGGSQWDDHPIAGASKGYQPLSRVNGIAFPSATQLKDWEYRQEEAARRDHRVIGKAQGLFSMNPLSPGSAFMLPHGTRIVQRLLDFLRSEYRRYGYEEVATPLLFNKELWVKSGHWENYNEDMFVVRGSDGIENIIKAGHGHGCSHHHHQADSAEAEADGAEEIHCLKPMNCPGHCLLFDSTMHSYRDLPVRYAEFSPLHRNEASGALTGLTRVRKFHQDDAHIFCTVDQIFQEISSTLDFVQRAYKIFQFPTYELTLSTRPENFLGDIAEWTKAEEALTKALDQTGRRWKINPGDGAFYGPKIDVLVRDALNRSHQTATIQLDFQLPQRFGLKYQSETGDFKTPVIVHRAILGSFERMLGVLIEHFAGKWPFWLSPRQATVIPVSEAWAEYARQVRNRLAVASLPGRTDPSSGVYDRYYYVDVDASDRTLNKRVREAQLAQYNFVLVVGAKEAETDSVSVRGRDGKDHGTMKVDDVLRMFMRLEADFE
ncbi:uncharacterized protein BJ171DRAFT_157782 [Polychytrium aggregatum]|uniref:uncharacterized protein n=1 Tax=Polychytrium aggregatum TaxID=110093 RepID=UPI0022FEDAA7|nr:uncharacterized protein BJ171DRAFT_157782 [Polychytrium aggregatum]KAI9202994.1 hypothetical protein BJ171DRAFT_157782 [Polychytrium aggregatum]